MKPLSASLFPQFWGRSSSVLTRPYFRVCPSGSNEHGPQQVIRQSLRSKIQEVYRKAVLDQSWPVSSATSPHPVASLLEQCGLCSNQEGSTRYQITHITNEPQSLIIHPIPHLLLQAFLGFSLLQPKQAQFPAPHSWLPLWPEHSTVKQTMSSFGASSSQTRPKSI